MKSIHLLGLAAMLWLVGPPAQAESLRCNGQSTEVGDSRISVLFKCGEPLLKDSHCAPVFTVSASPWVPGTVPVLAPALVQIAPGSLGPANVVPCLVVDDWLYDRGPGNLMATVRFQSGVVQAIQYARSPQ
jgi:hypothetical protein